MGQLSKSLEQSYQDTMQMLGVLGVAVIDYDLEDDMLTIEKLL